ncbi:MAG: MBL fold metallo-hydrolase [Bdellovibrionales bacterium]|nr:MBL fold metallo-hydrolase [Bdellovibrionales bacterium]
MSKIVDAVSIIITCGSEIFFIERHRHLKAFPGYCAFPGGKVEIGDESLFIQHPLTDGIDPKLFGAIIREGQEELGINLGQETLDGNVANIDYLGLAVTPDFNPFRFATHFYKFSLKKKCIFIVDKNEAYLAKWMSAAELLDLYANGLILAVPPVIKIIENLGQDPFIKTIPNLNFTYDKENHVPYIESLKSVRQLMPLSNTLPPATRTNAFIIGDNGPKILIDPSPKDDDEYRKLKNTIGSIGVDTILLTHHHPDHHERSTMLALELNVPMLMSLDTHTRLSSKIPDYFHNIKVSFVKEGDIVTKWLGRNVVVHEVPGHDEGQVALASEDMSWFLAGDLFQGVGTVVIGDDEGDMAKYFKTLEKVIALKPRVLFPSHGIGLGGTNILESTLEHRRMRETQILKFHQAGLNEDEMLLQIYAQVDQQLWPYARKNIQKHLEKLKSENQI